MKWTSILAIFVLFWVLSAFVVMPFHVRTPDETGEEVVPGHADSAPTHFAPLRIIAWTTLTAMVSFGLYYANYVNAWFGADMIALLN
jgi:predicted secreted protein